MQTLRVLKTIVFAIAVCAAAANVAGQQTVHAIVEAKEGCLIGAVQDKHWIAAEKIGNSIKSPLNVNLFTLQNSRSEILVSERGECHEWWKSQTEGELKGGIAIQSPTWNPMPRTPRAISTSDTTYVKIVRDILVAAGLRNPPVNITEGYKIDLDGDGKDEAIIIASHAKHGVSELTGIGRETAAGDYAIVLVRKIVGNKVRNIFLVKDIRTANEGGLARGYHLSAIADVNGDGQMEIVLYRAYYEGSSSDVMEIKGTKVNAVLGCGCEH